MSAAMGVDVGGTFTDVVLVDAEGIIHVAKVVTTPSDPRDGVRHGAAIPLALDLVIVDEASMIDLPMMCRLVEAVPAAATLVIVGDPDQLPSVDTGDVLSALGDREGAVAAWTRALAGDREQVDATAIQKKIDGAARVR